MTDQNLNTDDLAIVELEAHEAGESAAAEPAAHPAEKAAADTAAPASEPPKTPAEIVALAKRLDGLEAKINEGIDRILDRVPEAPVQKSAEEVASEQQLAAYREMQNDEQQTPEVRALAKGTADAIEKSIKLERQIAERDAAAKASDDSARQVAWEKQFSTQKNAFLDRYDLKPEEAERIEVAWADRAEAASKAGDPSWAMLSYEEAARRLVRSDQLEARRKATTTTTMPGSRGGATPTNGNLIPGGGNGSPRPAPKWSPPTDAKANIEDAARAAMAYSQSLR
ncbi:MAG: hypothetical protein ACKVW3_01895 [Phycisphaerales bacterium]